MNSLAFYRIRLRQHSSSPRFEDTHYIRKIVISGTSLLITMLDLLLLAADTNPHPTIDFLGSEWGVFTLSGDCSTYKKRK